MKIMVLVYLFVTNIQAGRPRVHDPSKISPDIAAPKQTIAETYNRDISTYNWPFYLHDPSKISPDIAAPKQTIAETYNRDISTYNWPYADAGLIYNFCFYYPQYCSDNANSNAANLDSQISQMYPNYLTQ